MKRSLILPLLLVLPAILMWGCTADAPGYTAIVGNPQVEIVDAAGNAIKLDSSTGAIATIEYEHHTIHNGEMFTVLEVIDLGNAEVHDHLIVTPDTTKWAHMVWEIEHELETQILFYKDTTYSDNGTEISSFNRDGNSTVNATTLVYHGPTVTDNGTLIATIQQGDGKKAGGADRESNEFILKQNSAYLIRITNLTVNDNLIFVKLNWYEHTNQ